MATEPDTPLLTDTQRRIVGAALTVFAFLGTAALIILALVVLGRLVGFFSGVIWPLAVAGVLALILRPLVDRAEGRLHGRRLAAVILLYGVFLLLATAVIVSVVPPLINQLLDFIAYLPTLWTNVTTYVQEHYPRWVDFAQQQFESDKSQKLTDTLAGELRSVVSHAVPSLRAAVGGLLSGFEFITHVAVIPVYLFFFLLMRGEPVERLGRHLRFLPPNVRSDVVFLITEFISIVEAFFRGQLLIGISIGVLYAIGFTIIGLKFGLFIGLALGILNIVPYLGTIIGLGTALPLAIFQPDGGWRLGLLVVVVKLIVHAIESWFLTPRIMGHQTGLHPAAIIFAIFFWGTAFGGVLGMLLAVPLTAFFVTVWHWLKRNYFTVHDG